MPTPAILAVIFDMDGVLVDSGEAHLKSWQELGLRLNRTVTPEQFASTFGQRSSDIIKILFDITDPVEVTRLDDLKEAIYRDLIRGHVPAMPGAAALLRDLHNAGFRLAVGSSGPPENVALICEEMSLRSYLSAIVTGADVQRGKPDPQVFQFAAQKMNVEPNHSVVVEDAPVGVEAAHRAGMKCIALTGSHPSTAFASADRVVNHLSEITPPLIRSLLSK